MLDYLVNYGVKRHNFDVNEIDVVDKMALQEQLNDTRRRYAEAVNLLDDINSKSLECSLNLTRLSKEIIEESISEGKKSNVLFSTNEEYILLEAQQEAFKAGLKIVNEQIDFYKSDLRILNSVLYSKF